MTGVVFINPALSADCILVSCWCSLPFYIVYTLADFGMIQADQTPDSSDFCATGRGHLPFNP
jgi:hypothetical protein